MISEKGKIVMRKRLIQLLLPLLLLLASVIPALAQDEIPEPFCGDLAAADCELLYNATAAMLDLTSYHTEITYRLSLVGLPELPVATSESELRVQGDYAFDDAARTAMRTLAVINRKEPLAAVQAIGESPALLIDLYRGMTADLTITLDIDQEWAELIAEDSEVAWPAETHVQVRTVDGVIYINLAELKTFIPELADTADWVAIEAVKQLEELAEQGAFDELAAGVASSSTGRSIEGMDPAMVNLITSMRGVFGSPELLEQFMAIERADDVTLDAGEGAYFTTEFDVLDFIYSKEFRTLLQQIFEIAGTTEDSGVDPAEAKQIADVFWLVAPAIFRDLAISSSSTVDLTANYQVASTSLVHWDLTSLVQILTQFDAMEAQDLADEIYIAFAVETQNSRFEEPITVTAPEGAEFVPLDTLGEEFDRTAILNPDETITAPLAPDETTSTTEDDVASAVDDGGKTGATFSGKPVPIPDDLAAAAVTHYEAGVAAYDFGDYEGAIEEFTQAIDGAPDYAGAYYQRGLAYWMLGQDDQALLDFEEATTLDATLTAAYYYQGQLYVDQGDYTAALTAYDAALDQDDEYVDAYVSRGYVYLMTEAYEAAIADYDAALNLDPDNVAGYNDRGVAYEYLEEYEYAIANYTAAIRRDDSYRLAYTNRADLYRRLEQYEKALADYNRAIELDDTSSGTYNDRGIVHEELEEYDAALADYTQAIALEPEEALYYRNRAGVYRTLSDDEAAIKDYTQAIALDPNDVTALYYRGASRHDLGDYTGARRDYQRVLDLDPADVDAQYGIGLLDAAEGDLEAAAASFVSATALDPDYAAPFNSACWTYALLNQPEEALPYCDTAINLDPQPYYYDSRGLAYALLGETDAAIADFQVFVDELAEDEDYSALVAKRTAWIAALEAGEDPFTDAVLEELRAE